jgi:hypothetical protein
MRDDKARAKKQEIGDIKKGRQNQVSREGRISPGDRRRISLISEKWAMFFV